MTRKMAVRVLLAIVMVASVIGTYSLLSAQDEARPAGLGERQQRERHEPVEQPRPESPRQSALEGGRRDRPDEPRLGAPRGVEEGDGRPRSQTGQVRDDRRMASPVLAAPPERARRPAEPERPPYPPERAEGFHRIVGVLEQMGGACFNPELAGLLAVGGLREDAPRRPEEVIADLESLLGRTRTLGLRNAIRIALRDIYKAEGNHPRVLEHLRAMLAENDEYLQSHPRPMSALPLTPPGVGGTTPPALRPGVVPMPLKPAPDR